jgi:anti-sigma regulatory factor (Ser/Thr protein kinase)
MDVVRAAVAEVEDFARVEVRRMPDVHVAGAAIADLTHLLAELVENATVFSPPHTRVQVHGSLVAAGYALEIEDRGLGMSADAMAEANRRLDSARRDDLFDSDRLGLFVVSRLARRHGIRVALQHSAYGGTAAVVLLPAAVLDSALLDTAALEAPTLEPLAAVAASDPRPSLNAASNTSPAPERKTPASAMHETVLVDTATAAQATAIPDEPDARPDPPREPDPRLDLPRRVRQANLAPGLRTEPEPPPAAETEREPATRTPERARATMSAYQKGWSQGRAAAESPDG